MTDTPGQLKNPRVLIFSVALNGYGLAFRRCLSSQREYARRISADYFVARRGRVKDPAIAAWMKLSLIRQALTDGYDYVAYLDADCEVSSSAPSFIHIADGADEAVLMAEGRSGRLNSGVIIVRNAASSRAWIQTVLESATEKIPPEDRANLRFENGNIIAVQRRIGGVARLPLEWNNTYDPELNDIIRHYTGPLKKLYKRPLPEHLFFRASRLFYPRALPAPEARDDQFVSELAASTARAWATEPRMSHGR